MLHNTNNQYYVVELLKYNFCLLNLGQTGQGSITPPNFRVSHLQYCLHFDQIILGLVTVLCIVGCTASTQASSHQMPVAHPLPVLTTKISPREQIHPLLRTTES